MPFTYDRDDHQRRIVITFHGQFQAEDGLASVERRRAERDTSSYGVLYDLRDLAGHPTIGDLKKFMSAEAPPPDAQQETPRGPFAILVTDPVLYSAACTYRALGRSTLTIEVFRDYAEADAWLKTHAVKLA
jgi:hypothetical protein